MSIKRLARAWRAYSQPALCARTTASPGTPAGTLRWYCGFFSGMTVVIVVVFLQSFGQVTTTFTG
jgi:hypothetical protein